MSQSLLSAANGNDDSAFNEVLERNREHINDTDSEGNTALMFVCARGFARRAQALMNANADVDKQNRFGQTALMVASTRHPNVVRTLIRGGANKDLTDNRNWNAEAYATRHIRRGSRHLRDMRHALGLPRKP